MRQIAYQAQNGNVLVEDETEAIQHLDVIALSPTVLFIEEEKIHLKKALEKKNQERLLRRRGEKVKK